MREEFTALVFGPDMPPAGARGALSISTLGIEISVGEQSQRIATTEVTLREVGFGRPGVEIAWKRAGERWAAHVLDADAAKRLLASSQFAATVQAHGLKSARRRHKTGRGIGWTLLALFVLLPAILLAVLILKADAIAGWMAEKIPVEQEIELGRRSFASMRGGLKLRDQGAAYDATKNIVDRLTKSSMYRYEIHVGDNATLNAFALPGGIVVVNSGLIKATKRPEELAGVLAHEVQHVELRHSIRGMIKQLGLRGLWGFVTGDLGGTLAGRAALEMTSLKFSRDDESEADSRGFDALVAADIDPSGMPAFFKTMSEQAIDAPAAFLSTHPLSEDREKALNERTKELNGRSFTPLDFGPWPPQLK